MATYTALQVFSMAMAAHRINGGYIKEDQWDYDTNKVVKTANKSMLKAWVRSNDMSAVTAEDVVKAEEVKAHFHSYLFLQLSGKINDFQQTAYKISQMTEFTERNGLEIAVASCMPSVYERDRQRKEFMEQLRDSTQLQGAVGSKIEGRAVVLSTRYNINFNKYKVVAKMGESFIDFWFSSAPAVGSDLQIKGKIKQLRDDNTTQLNYVKVL